MALNLKGCGISCSDGVNSGGCWTDALGFVTGVGRRVQETCRWNERNGYGRMLIFPVVFCLLLRKCTKEQGHAGSTEMGVVIQVGSGYGICFLLMHLSLQLV